MESTQEDWESCHKLIVEDKHQFDMSFAEMVLVLKSLRVVVEDISKNTADILTNKEISEDHRKAAFVFATDAVEKADKLQKRLCNVLDEIDKPIRKKMENMHLFDGQEEMFGIVDCFAKTHN